MEPFSTVESIEPEFYQLTIKNNLDELDILSDWVNQLASQIQLSARSTFRLELSLTEIVTNIIDYAYTDGAEHQITLSLHRRGKTLQIEIRDDGQPFDPLQHPAVVLPNSLEEATEGGLGIHLVRHYVDAWEYCRQEGSNILTLVIHDSDPSSATD